MTNFQENTSRRAIPRLAMINDIAGFGRCSTCVSLPVISAMQVQVCPVPTSVLSNHLGFPHCYFQDYTPYMRDYIAVWEKLGISFDGLYCGFLGNETQIGIVEDFLDTFRPPFFLLDPVMGDHGKTYSTVTKAHCEGLRRLAASAQLLTPNLTEACLLTDTPFQETGWTQNRLYDLCGRLAEICPGDLVITGIEDGDHLLNYIWQNGKQATCTTPKAGASRPGTGDLFASVLAADALYGRPLTASVRKASDFVALCIRGSEETCTPVDEGVNFEKYLSQLITS